MEFTPIPGTRISLPCLHQPPWYFFQVEATLFQMMAGACKTLDEAGAALLGGHTCEGSELSLGFAVVGCGRHASSPCGAWPPSLPHPLCGPLAPTCVCDVSQSLAHATPVPSPSPCLAPFSLTHPSTHARTLVHAHRENTYMCERNCRLLTLSFYTHPNPLNPQQKQASYCRARHRFSTLISRPYLFPVHLPPPSPASLLPRCSPETSASGTVLSTSTSSAP